MTLSAPLLTRIRLIKVGLETTKGTHFACVQGIQVMEPSIDWGSEYESRGDTGLYRGNAVAGVQVGRKGTCPFQAELRANGTHGMEAGLAIMLQACGFKKTAEVYQVHSSPADDKTMSLDYWQAGDRKGIIGANGRVVFSGDVGKRIMCKFDYDGNWQTPVTESQATFLTSMVAASTTPPMILETATFKFAYATTTPEIIKIASFELDMGNKVVLRGYGAGSYYIISNQVPTLKLKMEADLVAGFDYYARQLAATPSAVSLVVNDGTDKITFDIPAVISKQLTESDSDDIKMYDFEGECLHSAGNDSVKITAAVIA